MNIGRSLPYGLLCVLSLAACEASSDPNGSTASVTGQLVLGSYALRDPKVVAQNTTGAFFAAEVGDDGRFELELPGGEPYRLSVAEAAGAGAFMTVSRIPLADDDSQWARVEHGASVDLGQVRRADDDSQHDAGAASADGGLERENEAEEHGDAGAAQACMSGERSGEADLPYDVKLAVGDVFRLSDAFLEKGPKPLAIVRVTMDGAPWHLSELTADAAYTVTAADCSHQGNRDVGRDRIFVTWRNADGSLDSDHLDLRYCDGSGGQKKGGGSGRDDASHEDGGASGSGSGRDDGSHEDAGVDSDDDTSAESAEHEEESDDDCSPGKHDAPVCAAPAVSVSKCSGGRRSGVTPASAPAQDLEPRCGATTPPAAPPAAPPPAAPPASPAPTSLI